MLRQHAELRRVREQRHARAPRHLRRHARAHADDREQLAVRVSHRGAGVPRACARRDSSRSTSSARSPATPPSEPRSRSGRRACACSRSGWKRGSSTCWPGNTTTCSAGAAPASIRTASRSSGLPGQIYSRQPQIRVEQDVRRPQRRRAGRGRRRRRAPRAARQRGARHAGGRAPGAERAQGRVRAGVRAAGDRALRVRRVGRLAPVRRRRVPARAGRAQDRVRLGRRVQRVRARHRALGHRRSPQRAVVQGRGVDRQRHLRPLHRPHGRRAVPDAAEPGRPGAAAAVSPQHRQRHRHLRRRRQPAHRSTGGPSSPACSTTCRSAPAAPGSPPTMPTSNRRTSSR